MDPVEALLDEKKPQTAQNTRIRRRMCLQTLRGISTSTSSSFLRTGLIGGLGVLSVFEMCPALEGRLLRFLLGLLKVPTAFLSLLDKPDCYDGTGVF